jgi:hypothetical protein
MRNRGPNYRQTEDQAEARGWELGPAIPVFVLAFTIGLIALSGVVVNKLSTITALTFWGSVILGMIILLLFAILCALAGSIGGSIGFLLLRRYDAPPDAPTRPLEESRRRYGESFLFALVFSTLIFSFLSIPSLSFMRDHPRPGVVLLLLISFVSGLLPPGLKGILNNLRNEKFTD